MVDLLFAVAFLALPVAAWLVGRKLTPIVVALVFGFGLMGNLAQTTIGLGIAWNVRILQTAVLIIMAAVLGWAIWARRGAAPLSRQMIVVILPALAIGLFLIAMRVLADSAGPMSAIGYFINHPLAEDNAKWLHLSAQLADGRDISFNGYAGGPLLLLMSVMASWMSVLSMLWLGGVNEVAVAANTVLATQFLLIALIPFAFAPLAERTWKQRVQQKSLKSLVPAPLIWAGILVAVLASSVITSYGHLSLQFVLPILILWILCFAMPASPRERLVATLAIVTLASVWFPLNVLGVLLLLVALVWAIRGRRWLDLGLVVLTGLVSWDALFSSLAYMLGIDAALDQVVSSLPFGQGLDDVSVVPISEGSMHLFEAPGGTEIVQPIIGLLVLISVLGVVWALAQSGLDGRRIVLRLMPVVALVLYVLLVVIADAITTGRGPNYGANKLTFAVTIAVLAALLPLALSLLDRGAPGMTVLRWFAVGGVVVVLSFDTLLPRALSALSPVLWPAVNTEAPQYWSLAEVKDQADQPLSSLPVACMFIPQGGEPTALPLGQESYACTRLLIGLGGLEGNAGILPAVLQEDWFSNQSTWNARIEGLRATSDAIANRTVIVMTPEGGVAGISPLSELLARP